MHTCYLNLFIKHSFTLNPVETNWNTRGEHNGIFQTFAKSTSQSKVNVDGYVHEVSELKIPQTGNRASRYFDFKVQEREETKCVICFSPDKRDQLKENENSKTPVTLMNVSPQKRKCQLDQTEYKMNQYSNIVVKKNLPFPWKSLRTDLSNDSQTLKQIEDHKNPTAQVGNVVSVKAKLISKSDIEPVFTYKLNKTFNSSCLSVKWKFRFWTKSFLFDFSADI